MGTSTIDIASCSHNIIPFQLSIRPDSSLDQSESEDGNSVAFRASFYASLSAALFLIFRRRSRSFCSGVTCLFLCGATTIQHGGLGCVASEVGGGVTEYLVVLFPHPLVVEHVLQFPWIPLVVVVELAQVL